MAAGAGAAEARHVAEHGETANGVPEELPRGEGRERSRGDGEVGGRQLPA